MFSLHKPYLLCIDGLLAKCPKQMAYLLHNSCSGGLLRELILP